MYGLLADGTTVPFPMDPTIAWLRIIVEMGSFALLAYMVIKLGPDLMLANSRERRDRDKDFSAVVDLLQRSFESRNSAVCRAISEQTEKITAKIESQTLALSMVMKNAQAQKGPQP